MKKIIRVALNLRSLNDEALEVKVQFIFKSLTNNPSFPGSIPEVQALEQAYTPFHAALIAQRSGSKEDTARKNEMRVVLEQAYRFLANVVEAKSNNDLSVLLSSGFDARNTPTPAWRLEKPAGLQVSGTDRAGTVKLSLSKVPKAVSYMFQHAPSPVTDDQQWKTLTGTARSKIIDNLEPGKAYVFRAAGVGADPTVVFSDVVMRFVS